MLCDRYAYEDLFTHVAGLSLHMEPVLAQIDPLLDDDALFQRVRADLVRRYPHTATRGRPSTPVEVILRMLVVKHLYDWSYEALEYFVADSLTLRQFCRVYSHPPPDDTTLLRWAALIGPETLTQLNERVVALARQKKITRGRKLRVDTTVIETNIHPPADSSLLTDGVRVISRLLRQAKRVLHAAGAAAAGAAARLGPEAFRDRTRSMRQRGKQLRQVTRRKLDGEARQGALQRIYQGLLRIARQSRRQAEWVREGLQELARATGCVAGAAGEKTKHQAAQLAPVMERWEGLLARAIEQAFRRVMLGEVVPAADKLFSLFEPHTQIFQRGKAGKKVEFGRKLVLDEVEGGIISRYEVLATETADQRCLPPTLRHHQEQFGHAPYLLTADRGFYSGPNVKEAETAGVKRVVIPYSGAPGKAPPGTQARQHARWFRKGYRWRAGMEGRISVLQHRFGLRRCRDHGERGVGRCVGWGVLAHNLWQIGRSEAAAQAS